jgi:cytochrome c oxidase cbb3-type subunit 3
MTGVIFLEITVILVMLANVRILIAKQKQKKARQLKPVFNWWSKMNKFRPAHEEVQIDLGHSYDGIRELDNRLPPWWLYGFYVTIIFAGIYLWRYHISHSAPSSQEEYQIAMVKAEEQKEAYLKKAAANIDENTVRLLTQAADIQAGPNLTDEYWLHGGSVKDIFKTIKYGVPEKGMKSWKEDFSPKQLAQLSSYIKSLKGTNPPNAKEKQGELYKETAVTDSVKVIAANTNK